MANPYFGQANLENLMGRATVLAIFDDDGNGTVNQAALREVAHLASAWLDGKLARVYAGPFPIVLNPLPENVVLGALMYGKHLAYQRRPEYAKIYGEGPKKAAEDFADQLCEAKELLADYLGTLDPSNEGGLVLDNGPRMTVDGSDGTHNGGDFA
jgi:hypothetical protein